MSDGYFHHRPLAKEPFSKEGIIQWRLTKEALSNDGLSEKALLNDEIIQWVLSKRGVWETAVIVETGTKNNLLEKFRSASDANYPMMDFPMGR